MIQWTRRLLCASLCAAVLGCAGYSSFREAQVAEQHGDWDAAVLHYLELVDQYPQNLSYRAGLLRSKIKASQEHFRRAKQLHELGALPQAVREYEQAVQLDPANQFAQVEWGKARAELAAARGAGTGPVTLDEIKARAREKRPQPPQLDPRSDEPISLSFPNRVNIFEIYQALGKAFGINVQFDPKLRPTQLSIELEDVTAQEALEILMQTAGHFYKALSEDTIIIVEDNRQNRQKYEDLVIQTFYLSNAEVKDMMTLLRSLVGAKNIASNDQLNAIVLKDTADTVKVAERIIMSNDKARGEVVVDVELLQIDTSKLQDLGVSLSDYTVTQTLDQDPPLRVSDLEFINQANWIINIPGFVYDFVKRSTEAQLLASPQVRISDGEQASLTIGDQVPIPVTTFNTAQTVGGNIVPITSFQYQDIGIRLQMEPRLHHNREVTLNIEVEVASLSGFVEGSGGAQQPIIARRNIQSTIRLADGETNFLAGLIRDESTLSDQGIPGLSDIPVLGRLFSNKRTDKGRTDLVLTLTPHIVRTADITEEDLLPIWVGTESNLSFRGGSPQVESDVQGPFDEEEGDDQERIREMIRQRIQSLPQGLREGVDEEATGGEEPTGVDLVPASGLSDPFADEGDDEGDDDDDERPRSRPVADRGAGPRARPAVWLGQGARPRFAAASSDDEEPTVRLSLEADRPVVVVGDELTLSVVVDSDVPISHVPLRLRYDPARVEVVRIERGAFLGGEAEAAVLSDATEPGLIVLGASRLGDMEGVAGRGDVARVVFRALEPGATAVRFGKTQVLDHELRRIRARRKATTVQAVATADELPPAEIPSPEVDRDAIEAPPQVARAAVGERIAT